MSQPKNIEYDGEKDEQAGNVESGEHSVDFSNSRTFDQDEMVENDFSFNINEGTGTEKTLEFCLKEDPETGIKSPEKLGDGSFGVVYKVEEDRDGIYAVKLLYNN